MNGDSEEARDLEVKPSAGARRILLDGTLLETTEELGLKLSNNFDFSRRIVQEFSLILAGQSIKYLDLQIKDRAFSHCGIYGTHGFGKGFTLKLIKRSNIFPLDIISVRSLDNVTEAALIGTVTEHHLIPPPTVTEDILIVPEFSTLKSGSQADSIAAIIRTMQEDGECSRRLAKVGTLKDIIDADPTRGTLLLDELERNKQRGMTIDLDRSEIHVVTTTSWIIASAKFGSEIFRGRSLLSFGDIDRYRWRSYLPDREERFQVTAEVGSLPPIEINHSKISVCREAWETLIVSLRKATSDRSIKVPRDETSFYERKKLWEETQREMLDTYGEKLTDTFQEQLFNLRSRAEFTRLMYQHAALKQFQRDQGYDLAEPGKFIIDYNEDGEFARKLWINEYAPSMMDVITDILKPNRQKRSKRELFKIRNGEVLVLDLLGQGKKQRQEILTATRKAGISDSAVDNQILPHLITKGKIKRDKFGVYSLVGEQTKGC